MLRYTIKRLLQIIPVLFVVSVLVFLMVHMIPGDPVVNMLGMDAGVEAVEAMRETLGFNDPLPQQYGRFISGAVQGDMGVSIFTRKPVTEELIARLIVTFKLALGGIAVATIVGVLFGVIAAVKQNKFTDNLIMVLSLLCVSTPSFFLALLFLLLFTLTLGWLPSMGVSTPLHYILPSLTLGMSAVGLIARTTRSAMLDVLHQDYIRTSRSRGIPERVVILAHAFKNALIPVITAIGLRFGGLLAGAALIETVFSIPGIGSFLITGVLNRDYPVVQGSVLLMAVIFVVVNLIVDLVYALVDPRVKYE